MSKLRVNTIVNRTNDDKVTFPFGIGVTNGIVVAGVVTATYFVGSGVSLTNVPGEITIQQPSGEVAFSGITTIRIGSGLTANQPSVGIVLIRPNGNLDSLRVTGIATFGTTGLTTFNAATGQLRSLSDGNILPQRLVTKVEFTPQLATDFDGALVYCKEDNNVYLAATTGIWHQMARANHTLGIITASGGFVATGSNIGFTGPLNSTGISTAAFLQATTINVSAAATVGTALTVTQDLKVGRHVLVSGITTATDLIVNNITVNGGITGKINSSGVSTITQLVATTVNASGIVTASTFSGPLTGQVTGNVTGNVTGEINSTGVGTVAFLQNTHINSSGIHTAATFSGTTATFTNTNSTNTVLSGLTTVSNTVAPNANNTVSLGTSGNRWSNVFSNDLDLSNEGSANDIDGTWGSFLVQEGEESLYIINRRSGKKFRFVLEELV